MLLLLDRKYKKTDYTIGKLYVDGEYFCDTLEDADRGLSDDMTEEEISSITINGSTAIPTGTYDITLDVVSPKYKSRGTQYSTIDYKLPRLLNCKGFTGVLIHIGNTNADTDGCILVGENNAVGKVLNSTATFYKLYDKLLEDKNDIRIMIC